MKKKTIFKFKSPTSKLLSAVFLSVCIVFSICVHYSFADVPCKINYQGRLIENNVPVDGTKTMKFSIYNEYNYLLWTSGEVDVTVYNGLFRYVLGSDVEDLSSIPWTAGETLYLEVQVGRDILQPREAIYAYPYAINSHLLEGATKGYFINTSGETQKKDGGLNIMGDVGIGTTDPEGGLDIKGNWLQVTGPTNRILGKIKLGMGPMVPEGKGSGTITFWDGTATDLSLVYPSEDVGYIQYKDDDFVIMPYGNLGIGTTEPGAKLEVDGDILSDTVGYDSEGAYRYCKINGNKTKVYTKYLTGTLDADSATAVAHGVTAANIVAVSYIIYSSNSGWYYVGEIFHGVSTDRAIYTVYDSTNISFKSVGSWFQGQAYRIRIDYTL